MISTMSFITATILTVTPAACGTVTDVMSTDVNDTVVKVVDGDTVDTKIVGRIRILGIDTPEVYGGKECWGPEASDFAKETLTGKTVIVRRDITQDKEDHYGRTLAYVILQDGSNYSVLAAEAGAAESYVYKNNPVQAYDDIVKAELRAMSEKRGLWGACPRESER